ncbi:MAG TPA: hypothetical protein VFX50_12685, partial [Gemmatimonadales bacterium]|nr:hypothetical protein [Gemmatimonadales bacterium]
MNRIAVPARRALAFGWLLVPVLAAGQPAREVYRCPGDPVLYTDALTAKEARERGCRTLEGAPITVVQTPRPPAPSSAAAPRPAPAAVSGGGARSSLERVAPAEQRARDADARR